MKNFKFNYFQKYFLYFICFSFIGWIYEEFLAIFVYNLGIINRGFLFGPYLPVYGIGAIILIVLLDKYKKKSVNNLSIKIFHIFSVFLLIILITTTLELITSYLMEWTIGEWLWNYDNYAFNFQGRIALNTSVRFGLGGMVFLYIIQPLLDKFCLNFSHNKYFKIILYIILIIFIFDLSLRPFLGSNFSEAIAM